MEKQVKSEDSQSNQPITNENHYKKLKVSSDPTETMYIGPIKPNDIVATLDKKCRALTLENKALRECCEQMMQNAKESHRRNSEILDAMSELLGKVQKRFDEVQLRLKEAQSKVQYNNDSDAPKYVKRVLPFE
jgi:hypothetical protein